MLYVPGRFLFIHIPRSAGISITTALVRHLAQSEPETRYLCSTTMTPPFHQHATVKELRPLIPDWSSIHKFAIYREPRDIYRSDYAFHLMQPTGDGTTKWGESVTLAHDETLPEFIDRRWQQWTHGETPWRYWTECWPDIMRYDYASLGSEWWCLLRDLDLPTVPLVRSNGSHW